MTDGRYFQTTKRGEIHELKEELHSSNKEKKKEAVKKVIAAMTVGKDVSSLFPDVVNCMQTTNIELKKLVYLYVINYAKAQPELAILAVNTFRKDSLDPNPLIRALAVRTMGCIRLEQISEYLVEPLRRCCKDSDPYVRKTAAICVAKLYDISPTMVEEQGFIEVLYELLGDSNPMVVANAIAAIAEISESSGKPLLYNVFTTGENNVSKLLAALNECNEWGQVFILDALAMYQPETPREAESVLERITARLSHANSAVVLSATKVTMLLLDKINNNEVIRSTQKKLCPPLVTLLSAEPEIQYVALKNINLIVQKRPAILANEVKMFFCKYNDPIYVKMEKLDVMVRLTSERNMDQVLSELREYSTEVDVDFVRKSVRAIGRIAIRIERSTEKAVNSLIELIDTRVNYVVQEAIIVIKDIFRKYPDKYEGVIASLCENLDGLDEPEARSSMIWIIGEYAERIDNAESLMEGFLESFHDEATSVQLQILTATVKIFLKSPSNTQDMVTNVLKMSTEESNNPDLRDRAYIYWRLLSRNPEATKKVVLAQKPQIRDDLSEFETSELNDLTKQLSMLASVFHKQPAQFVTRLRVHRSRNDDPDLSSDSVTNGTTANTPKGRKCIEDSNGDSAEDFDEDNDCVERVKEQMEQQVYNSEDEDDNTSTSSESSDDSGPTDLLGMDDADAKPSKGKKESKFPPIKMHNVLTPQSQGSRGQTGLEIAAGVDRHKGKIALSLCLINHTASPLSGFAIQLNKNSFGLAPATGLQVADIPPRGKAEVVLFLNPNQLNSRTSPSSPMILQGALKCSLDIFYFNVQYDISVVLAECDPVDRDMFKTKWQAIGDAKQAATMAVAKNQVTPEAVIEILKRKNISLVAQRSAETFDSLYFSCVTTNNLLVLAEVSLQKTGNHVKVAIRTDAPPLVPLIITVIMNILQVTKI